MARLLLADEARDAVSNSPQVQSTVVGTIFGRFEDAYSITGELAECGFRIIVLSKSSNPGDVNKYREF